MVIFGWFTLMELYGVAFFSDTLYTILDFANVSVFFEITTNQKFIFYGLYCDVLST